MPAAITEVLAVGWREEVLRQRLGRAGYPLAKKAVPFPTETLISNSRLSGEVQRVYRALGGLGQFVVGIRRDWDITIGGVAVELDEEQHFNRYRLLTLGSPIYKELKLFPLEAYQSYCRAHERECLKKARVGNFWSNVSCERQYGAPSGQGDLAGNGSPRWKQRAFYDFVKDLTPLLLHVPMSRVCVWDSISIGDRHISVDKALAVSVSDTTRPLVDLIELRAGVRLTRAS